MDFLKLSTNIIAISAFSLVGYKALNIAKYNNNYISTIGLSDRIVDSDEVLLTINIRNDANSPKDVAEKRILEKKKLLEFIKQNGVQDSEIDKVFCNIEENYNHSDEKKYKILDKVLIKSSRVADIKKLSENLSKLIDDGICLILDLKYYYRDMEKLRVEMVGEAAKDAITRAKRIAEVTGVQIKRLRNFSTGVFSISPADSLSTKTDEWESEKSLKKRVRVVVHGSYNIG